MQRQFGGFIFVSESNPASLQGVPKAGAVLITFCFGSIWMNEIADTADIPNVIRIGSP